MADRARPGERSAPVRRRQLPAVTPLTQPFWDGGGRGELRIQRCRTCGRFLHPPGPVCRYCLGDELEFTVVSGRGSVHTFTVNHHPWAPDLQLPYVIAIVDLDDAVPVRLLSNIVGCPADDVHIGMPVEVTFERQDGVHLPLFAPARP